MKKPVVIINCSAKKLAVPAMAADLYCDPNSLNHMVNKHLGRAGGELLHIKGEPMPEGLSLVLGLQAR